MGGLIGSRMEKKKAEKQKRNLKQEKEKEKKESERLRKNIREKDKCEKNKKIKTFFLFFSLTQNVDKRKKMKIISTSRLLNFLTKKRYISHVQNYLNDK